VDGLDIIVHGNENIGYNNTGYAKELKIESGHNNNTNPMPLNSGTGVGMIFVGDYNSANSVTGYNKNVIFANQGYVESGSVKLNHIEVNGDDNTIAYFGPGRGNYMSDNHSITGEAGVGLFAGNGLVFQGIIGRYALSDGTTSKGNVGVYASSGQRSGLNTNAIIGQGTSAATYFSNEEESHKSSLGFYVTGKTYNGDAGFSLKLYGNERYYNSNAYKRGIVIHTADYMNEDFLKKNGRFGRSLGCPVLPTNIYKEVIETIKEGTMVFAYYTNKRYLASSKYLKVSSLTLNNTF